MTFSVYGSAPGAERNEQVRPEAASVTYWDSLALCTEFPLQSIYRQLDDSQCMPAWACQLVKVIFSPNTADDRKSFVVQGERAVKILRVCALDFLIV